MAEILAVLVKPAGPLSSTDGLFPSIFPRDDSGEKSPYNIQDPLETRIGTANTRTLWHQQAGERKEDRPGSLRGQGPGSTDDINLPNPGLRVTLCAARFARPNSKSIGIREPPREDGRACSRSTPAADMKTYGTIQFRGLPFKSR